MKILADHSLPMSEQLSSWFDICQTKACKIVIFYTEYNCANTRDRKENTGNLNESILSIFCISRDFRKFSSAVQYQYSKVEGPGTGLFPRY